ncbi:MAG: putative bifunctional diguanylate cyclase/phosphodiesterase [Actinomycetes bacterium]
MSASAEGKGTASWAFDGAVMTVGAVIGLLAVGGMLFGGQNDLRWTLALLVGAPVIAVMSRFPLVLDRTSGGIEVGFDSAVLVFLACFDQGAGALAVWVLGQALSQLGSNKRIDVRVFNVGLGILSGHAALLVMRSISPLDATSPRELMAVALGCAVYFLVDYVVSGLSIALEEGTSAAEPLRHGSALAALGVFVSIDSLGYLGALVVRELPGWASLLLAVPLLTILVAARALSRGNEHRRRLAALFDAAAAAQGLRSRDELVDVLRTHTRRVVVNGRADLGARSPKPQEVGARVRTGTDELWLVSPAVNRARASVQADQQALEALAAVGEEAFARLSLVEEMGRLARQDSLTGLPNRTLFLDRVERAVARSRRSRPRIAVLFLDLDGFKAVNDRFGHAEGDELLKTVAARLVGCVRTGDSVARLGGDEFAVLVEDVGGPGEVEDLCQRLLAALRAEIVIGGHDVVVGTSIGVALAGPRDDAAGLLRNADMAMYRAKTLGKDRYLVYRSSLREENIRRLEMIEELRAGIATDLVVHYQPVVDFERGRIDGMEALVRWRRNGQLVAPDAFIPAAEDSGLVVELGERVLAQVLADAPSLVAAAGRPLTLGVNMSAHQLREPCFVDQVRAAVAALGDSQLVLEMTETVLVSDDDDTVAALRELKALGAKLAIDDFGVGFSSIGYLQHLPVDILKIDRSFTAEVDTHPRAAALIDAILVMGSALGLGVVAEGIERPAQVERLRQAGCPLGQGFLYARPQPLADAVVTLRRDAARSRAAAVRPAAVRPAPSRPVGSPTR